MMGGFTLEVPIPKLEKKGTLYNEITVSLFDANSSVRFSDSLNGSVGYYEVNQKFAPNLISITTMFRYCFANGVFKYYVSAGIYNSFVISPANARTTVHSQNGNTQTTEEDAVPQHSIHGLMLIVGTGISYKYAGLEIRYDPGRNYTRKVDYSVYNSTISLLLHVRFNPK